MDHQQVGWGLGEGQAGAEGAGWLETLSVPWAGAEKTGFSRSLFRGSRKTLDVVVTPQGSIAMETGVVSKATSKAALPAALLGCSYTGVQASEKGNLSGKLPALETSPKSKT